MNDHPNARPMRVRILFALAALATVAVVTPAAAQEPKDAAHDCKRAAQIVAKGKPEKKLEWALSTIGDCREEGGEAAASAWTSLGAESDTAVLAMSLDFWTIRDGRLLAATLAVARNPAATPAARGYALLNGLAVTEMSGRRINWSSLSRGTGCRRATMPHFRHVDGTVPLPATANDELRQAAEGVIAGGAQGWLLDVARCVVELRTD